ncbi:hypothetical protein ARAM_002278 [Aspergillus rambellii]|uniref:SET domain-containing protein n=1 Tax=Aspergillus rambellii TaxID=308745 RepID=A0A0F8VVX1_9EURO|nr:hypothetical protein ARAM_002278 [Aspergillus rambellii]
MSTESTTAEPSIKVTTTPTTTSLRPWIHPHLTHSVNPIKGRQLETSHPIKKGEVLLIDTPYAIIPAVDAAGSALLCSNPQCNRLVSPNTGQSCPNRCLADVIWCNQTCRQTDQRRHEFECAWLSRYATSVRSKRGEYNFGMLWLIVRILARQNTDTLLSDLAEEESNPGFQHGWEAIQSLCGSTETWSHEQVRSWTGLAKKYLGPAALPHGMNAENVLALICKEEANSFGLYPRETGIFHPLPTPPVDRGEQFGAAVYPRASIANHSCCPNVSPRASLDDGG